MIFSLQFICKYVVCSVKVEISVWKPYLTCTVVLHCGHTFLRVLALLVSIGNNSQCTELTEETKKFVEERTKNRHVALCAYSEKKPRVYI